MPNHYHCIYLIFFCVHVGTTYTAFQTGIRTDYAILYPDLSVDTGSWADRLDYMMRFVYEAIKYNRST